MALQRTLSSKDGPWRIPSKTHVRHVAVAGEGPFHVPKELPPDVPKARGVSIRKNKKWLCEVPAEPLQALPVPLFNQVGKNTGLTLYEWRTNLPSYVASVCSTIARRLLTYAHKHNSSKVVSRFSRVLPRVAAYYFLTWNGYLLDRILYFLRNLEKRGSLIHRVLLCFVSKLDVHKRFVYSQVCFQTNWLLFRALRPRDKSKFMIDLNGSLAHGLQSAGSYKKFSIGMVREILGSIYPAGRGGGLLPIGC